MASLSITPMKTLSPGLKFPTATRVAGSTYSGGRVFFSPINKGFAKSAMVIKSPNMSIQPLMKSSRCLSKCYSMSGGGAAQGETVTVNTPNAVASPFMGKQKDPKLDNGGSGIGGGKENPPFYRGGGGGGGGGFSLGGSFSWAAFWFFLVFQFIKFFFMRDKEGEERFKRVTGRRKTIRHYLDY